MYWQISRGIWRVSDGKGGGGGGGAKGKMIDSRTQTPTV